MSRTLTALDREWRRITRDPSSTASLETWADSEPSLSGYKDLAALLDARRDDARAGEIISALARLAARDDLAARTLMQALVPGIVRLAVQFGPEDDNALDELVSIAWERIRTYPHARNGSTAANILMDVRKRYRCHRDIEKGRYDERLVLPEPEPDRSPEDVVVERDLIENLLEARRRGMLSDASMRAIARTRIEGESIKEAADAEQVGAKTLIMRRWRGEQGYRAHLKLAS